MTIYSDTLHWSGITPIFDPITDVDLITEFDLLPNCERFPRNICNGCGMPTEDACSSEHLVLSHFGTCKYSNVETNLSWTCLVSGLLSFEHPLVLLLLLLSMGAKRLYYHRRPLLLSTWIHLLLPESLNVNRGTPLLVIHEHLCVWFMTTYCLAVCSYVLMQIALTIWYQKCLELKFMIAYIWSFTGNYSIRALATPLMYDVVYSATKRVPNPDPADLPRMKTVYDKWFHSIPNTQNTKPR